ncbi:MAG: hypothetical protein OXT70_01215 [Chloroflexota bacterium]|nr:hypothetical protein [Chloroflexota bacterium]
MDELIDGEGSIVVNGVTVSLLNVHGREAPDSPVWDHLAHESKLSMFEHDDHFAFGEMGQRWLVSIPSDTEMRLRLAVGRDLARAIRLDAIECDEPVDGVRTGRSRIGRLVRQRLTPSGQWVTDRVESPNGNWIQEG